MSLFNDFLHSSKLHPSNSIQLTMIYSRTLPINQTLNLHQINRSERKNSHMPITFTFKPNTSTEINKCNDQNPQLSSRSARTASNHQKAQAIKTQVKPSNPVGYYNQLRSPCSKISSHSENQLDVRSKKTVHNKKNQAQGFLQATTIQVSTPNPKKLQNLKHLETDSLFDDSNNVSQLQSQLIQFSEQEQAMLGNCILFSNKHKGQQKDKDIQFQSLKIHKFILDAQKPLVQSVVHFDADLCHELTIKRSQGTSQQIISEKKKKIKNFFKPKVEREEDKQMSKTRCHSKIVSIEDSIDQNLQETIPLAQYSIIQILYQSTLSELPQ